MKRVFPILVLLLMTALSCKKEVIETPEDSGSFGWTAEGSSYVGDWNLNSTVYFENWWQIDSMDVFQSSELFMTLTDSALPEVENEFYSNSPYYYGKLFQDGEEIELQWNNDLILSLSNPDSVVKLFADIRFRKFNDNKTLRLLDMQTGNHVRLQKSDLAYEQDSITYRVAFSSAPPKIGLMLGYTNSDGDYTIDTLKSGNWEWEKKVLQTGTIRDYKLEIVGATDSFFEAIDSDYFASITLQWSYGSANGTHHSEKGLKDNIAARFYTDGTADFGTNPIIKFRLKFID